ncbi:hypothetical protein [uncultured Neptuniibacter sp.]|uniref:hypothetical protein n=1 Tax=uncultured Neptuniibacter sp. TaxID=502143 RepID=UPI0026396498|nr:hypothetical protein [uncultured Neptuniibacter sp.]
MKKITLLCSTLLLVLLLGGCGYNLHAPPQNWLKSKQLYPVTADNHLTLCQDFGCSKVQTVQFDPANLQPIYKLFHPISSTPSEERARIAEAVGLMEQLAGPQLRTENDLPRNQYSFDTPTNQLDCIAESLNTTSYLLLFEQHNLLQFHRTGSNIHRGPLTLNAPHNSATVIDNTTNQAYAVDSWFYKNGEPAWVIPVDKWLSGSNPL